VSPALASNAADASITESKPYSGDLEMLLYVRVLTQLSLFAVPALAMSLIFKDVYLKGLHYRA
jgi:hypothetical protein